MNKNFIALTKSEQRQITGGSWFTKILDWCKEHLFGWSTEPRYPGAPCLFNFYAEYIVRNTKKHKLESRLPGEISIISDMQMTPPLCVQKVKKN